MSEPVFTNWTDENTRLWGEAAQRLSHSLSRHRLFTMEGIAALIDSYPRDEYELVQPGAQGGRRAWDTGDLGGLNGAQVVEAIAAGRLWLSLRRLHRVRPDYRAIVERAFGELSARTGLDLFNPTIGLLISSPGAQVYYHADLPGQMLFQLHGRKRVYIYPNRPPFIRPEHLEDIAANGIEEDVPYDPAYDAEAQIFDIGPGEMLHWPLNAPHRVENLGVLNVSMTAEYWTGDIERRHRVNLANGLMRHRFGLKPKSRALSGPPYWLKAAFQAGMRRTPWAKQVRMARKPMTFRLDPKNPGAILPVEKKVLIADAV